MNNKSELNTIKCKGCKALIIKPELYDEKIKYWRSLQMDAILKIKKINVYILIPFLSPDRFFYDTETDAWHRNDLKRILLKGSTDHEFLKYLSNHGIAIVECCFCPLHRFFLHDIPFSVMSEAITNCFRKHNLHILKLNNKAGVITLFEEPGSFSEGGIPEINNRIIKNFEPYKLDRSNKRFRKLIDSMTGI